MTKTCSKCQKNKDLQNFYKRRSGKEAGKHYSICKECFKKRGRAYYHKNRDRQLMLARKRFNKYLKQRLTLLAKIKDKPCMDCKKHFPPWIMDFDHLKPKQKSGNISHLFTRGMWSIERVKKEIEKCELVCANCHRQRTFSNRYLKSRNNYLKVLKSVIDKGHRFNWNIKKYMPS